MEAVGVDVGVREGDVEGLAPRVTLEVGVGVGEEEGQENLRTA